MTKGEKIIYVYLSDDQTSPRFGISEKDARDYVKDILTTVRDNWEKMAKEYGLSRGQIEDMRPAFDIC